MKILLLLKVAAGNYKNCLVQRSIVIKNRLPIRWQRVGVQEANPYVGRKNGTQCHTVRCWKYRLSTYAAQHCPAWQSTSGLPEHRNRADDALQRNGMEVTPWQTLSFWQ